MCYIPNNVHLEKVMEKKKIGWFCLLTPNIFHFTILVILGIVRKVYEYLFIWKVFLDHWFLFLFNMHVKCDSLYAANVNFTPHNKKWVQKILHQRGVTDSETVNSYLWWPPLVILCSCHIQKAQDVSCMLIFFYKTV